MAYSAAAMLLLPDAESLPVALNATLTVPLVALGVSTRLVLSGPVLSTA